MKRYRLGALLVAAVLVISFTVVAPAGVLGAKSTDEFLDKVVENIDMNYAQQIVEDLQNMGTATSIEGESLGFRGAGSSSSHEASLYVRDEMDRIGLTDVTLDEIPVDAWEFRGAWVDIPGLGKMQAASFGGSPNTSGEITAEIVDVGDGLKEDYEGKDVEGKIVLVNWWYDAWPDTQAMEAYVHGAIAMVLTTYDSLYGMQDGELQCHDGLYRPWYPPLLSITGNDGLAIIELLESSEDPVIATVWSDIVITYRDEGGFGWNVVGYLPGTNWGQPNEKYLIIGDHTDAWFFGACDNNAGVAGVLVLAEAFKKACDQLGQLEYTLVFVTHEAEEYGIVNTYYDWCYGAWYEITYHHPEWAGKTIATMIIDCVGFEGHSLAIEVTDEISSFAHKVVGQHKKDLPYGADFHTITVWADHWTYAASGIPSILFSDWEEDYTLYYYHSQYDNIDIIDFDYLRDTFEVIADMAYRFVTLPVLPYNFETTALQLSHVIEEADKFNVADLYPIYTEYGVDPETNLNRMVSAAEAFSENAALFADGLRNLEISDPETLDDINQRLIDIQKVLGRSLVAMGVWEENYFPYQQSALDVKFLASGIDILSKPVITYSDIMDAICDLNWVGITWYYDYISEANYLDIYDLSYGTGMVSWGTQTHLLPAVDIWDEYDELNQFTCKDEISADDVADIVSSLRDKMITQAIANLEESLETMWVGLEDANAQLVELISIL